MIFKISGREVGKSVYIKYFLFQLGRHMVLSLTRFQMRQHLIKFDSMSFKRNMSSSSGLKTMKTMKKNL